MRLRFLLSSTLALATVAACGSTSSQPTDYDSEVAPPSELSDETTGTEDVPPADESEPMAASAPAAAQGGQTGLQDEVQRQSVLQERQQFLAAEYLARGDEFFERADLENALAQYSQALQVMPSNAQAKESLRKVEALMGDRFATAAQSFDDALEREAVRRAQAQLSAEQAKSRGDAAMRAGQFNDAATAYREALLILRYHPLIATDDLSEASVRGSLDQAVDMANQSAAAEESAARAAAQAERETREAEQARYRETRLATLYAEAHAAFSADNYKKSESLARQILLEDPGNEMAETMRDASQAARHQATDEETRRKNREGWLRTFEELDTMDVPQTEALVFNDLKRWAEVNRREPLQFGSDDGGTTADTQAVLERLESTRFAPKFVGPDGEGSPLSEIATFLQGLTGVNFLISTRVRDELDEEQTTIKLSLPERSVRKVLDIIADTSESLRWKVQDGVVMFVTKDELQGGQVLRFYEVRDIIHPVPNFAGREINISPSGGLEQPDEEFEEREGLVVTGDALEGLIRENVAPLSWDEDPRNSVRITEAGTMVVNQTPEVQELVQTLLDDLREATGIMVDIQARFLKVEDNFLEDIGVDFRGLGQPGQGTNTFLNDYGDASTQGELGQEIGQGTDLGAFFDDGLDGDVRSRVENLYDVSLGDSNVLTNAGGLSFQWTYLNDLQLEMILRAVSKSERLELVTAPKILVFNTARSNIAVLNQVAYVQDFDVEIAQAASIADPIVNVVPDGVVLDVRPVVSADRRFIMMELRPTVATLVRPIQQIATTLGSQNTVTIQLPELDIQRVRTTVPMPDGGTVMLGGLKVSEKQALRSGVPILNKIPIVRFLFERKGNYISNRKLLILIKAGIVIPEEHEPTPSQTGS
jgi:type II secretory pathway component GspD/PulD (secretin)